MNKALLKFNLIISLIFYSIFSFAQKVDIEWEYVFEHQKSNDFNIVKNTKDGGCIVGGYIFTEVNLNANINVSYSDYFVAKLTSEGKVQWKKVYGGERDDFINAIIETKDGGYIIGGSSDSHASGNKAIGTNGVLDIWILKLDHNGEIEWQQSYGGGSEELFGDIVETDNGYLIGGSSWSIANGNKTAERIGRHDYWIINIDKQGNLIWDKTYGGDDPDVISNLTVLDDGNFLVSGSSYSDKSSYKSEDSRGQNDFWLVKIDASGNLLWEKTIGGYNYDYCLEAMITSDGNVLIAGRSISGVSYDKTESFHYSPDFFDYWIIKMDIEGNEIWQKSLPADSYSLIETKNNGFAIISFKYFDVDFEHNPISLELFIQNYDQDLNYMNEIFIGSFFDSKYYNLLQTNDQGFILAGSKRVKMDDSRIKNQAHLIKIFDEVNTDDLKNNINVYPNPFFEKINIDYAKDLTIKMYNDIGCMIIETKSKSFSIKNLSQGLYMLHIYNIKGDLISINKLIKRL